MPGIGFERALVGQGLRGGRINPGPSEVIYFIGYGRVAPGSVGTAVVAAHVATSGVAGPFAKLSEVAVGDTVTLRDESGVERVYTVTTSYVASKDDLTHDAKVWGGNSSVRRLAIVTCDDALGMGANGHRMANHVVIAEAQA